MNSAPLTFMQTLPMSFFTAMAYSVAQDRLFQMEMAKRSTQGSVSEVLGGDYLDFDINARTLYSPASIKAQLAALSQKDRDIFHRLRRRHECLD